MSSSSRSSSNPAVIHIDSSMLASPHHYYANHSSNGTSPSNRAYGPSTSIDLTRTSSMNNNHADNVIDLVEEEDILAITNMGFSQRHARYAYKKHRDVEAAVLFLMDMEEKKAAVEPSFESTNTLGRFSLPIPTSFMPLSIFTPSFTATDSRDRSPTPSPTSSSTSAWKPWSTLSRALSALTSRARSPSPLPHQGLGRSASDSSPRSRRLEPKFPAPQSPPPSLNQRWTCTYCTFSNIPDRAQCEMCESSRSYSPEERKWQSEQLTCEICLDDVHASFIATKNSTCGHLFCYSCFYEYLCTSVEDGKVLQIKCPQANCPREVSPEEISSILDPFTLQRYHRFKRNAELSNDTAIRWCVNPSCDSYIRVNPSSSLSKYSCPTCHVALCAQCRNAWHEGKTCDQASREAGANSLRQSEVAFFHYMHENIGIRFRQCEKCGIWVERASGCAKMTCRCGHRFCFVCGVAEATCGCTPRYHMFYPLQSVLSNWNNRGPD